MEDGSAARKNLLDRLLSSVKQVQIHFGARQEIATETDLRVATLCSEWEAVLLHGMKRSKPKGLSGIGKGETPRNLWTIAKLTLSPDEVQRFSKLSHVATDVGRGRAWLRAAINERTLENYLHILLAEEDNLKLHYESYALILNQESSNMLPVMAAGLGSIIFSIPIDVDYLNSVAPSVDVPAIPAVSAPPTNSSYQSFPSRPTTTPSAFNRGPMSSQPTSSPAIFDRVPTFKDDDDDDIVAVSAKGEKDKKKKRKKKSSPSSSTPSNVAPRPTSQSPSVSPAPPILPIEPHPQEDPMISQDLDEPRSQDSEPRSLFDELQDAGVKPQDSISTSSSRVSLNSNPEESSNPTMYVSLDNYGMIPGSETEAAVNATAQVLSAMSGQQGPETVMPISFSAAGGSGDDKSLQEMKETLLSVIASKEMVDERNRELEKQLHDVQQSRQQLILELDHYQTELRTVQESHTTQQQALERENDLLREQLKKYVGMVQQHRRDTTSKVPEGAPTNVIPAETSPSKELEIETSQNHSLDRTDSNSAEQKLSEMAEMYADLMELNGRLHKDISTKDSVICKLAGSLRQAGLQIPVPSRLLPPNAIEKPPPSVTQRQPLVSVWIPSVIKRGRGPDAHHVYQIFIRVKAEEWNVYRRYNEFREFHRQLQHYTIDVSDFSFPPKKARNKTAQVVEERRKRLQEYLRFVIKVCSTKALTPKNKKAAKKQTLPQHPVIQASITKATLVTMFPFFKEDLDTDSSGSSNFPPPLSPSYSGL